MALVHGSRPPCLNPYACSQLFPLYQYTLSTAEGCRESDEQTLGVNQDETAYRSAEKSCTKAVGSVCLVDSLREWQWYARHSVNSLTVFLCAVAATLSSSLPQRQLQRRSWEPAGPHPKFAFFRLRPECCDPGIHHHAATNHRTRFLSCSGKRSLQTSHGRRLQHADPRKEPSLAACVFLPARTDPSHWTMLRAGKAEPTYEAFKSSASSAIDNLKISPCR